jgi:hypothetical protein
MDGTTDFDSPFVWLDSQFLDTHCRNPISAEPPGNPLKTNAPLGSRWKF